MTKICAWCMKPKDSKHPERTGQWLLISYQPAWNVFKSHTIVSKDDAMRGRINCLINTITDPFAAEIRYHHKCLLKYITPYQKMSSEQKIPLLQKVTFCEAQTMFIDHVRQAIFVDHETRTLQGLLKDYQGIMETYGLPTSGTKSSYIKDILIREFGTAVGFCSRSLKNHNEVVYDRLVVVVAHILRLLSRQWGLAMSN